MKVTVLGSGTSTGVPIPGCRCAVCVSSDERNKRLRTSVLVELHGRDLQHGARDPDEVVASILVDTSTDLRAQALRAGFSRVDAVVYTHIHADHVCGIDDLRSFNFINRSAIDVWATETTGAELKRMFWYAFEHDPNYLGGAPPQLNLRFFEPYSPFEVGGAQILPLPVRHGTMEVIGFRIGDFAYITDCSEIPQRTRAALGGLQYLILDGLRVRPHRTHFNHEQAVAEIERVRPAKSYLTHITHEVDHEEGNRNLSGMTELDVSLAYDGLTIEL